MGRLIILALISSVLFSCKSAEDFYKEGSNHEASGNYLAASNSYIGALKKDRNFNQAKGALQGAGAKALTRLRNSADSFSGSGKHYQALDPLRTMESLMSRSLMVGIRLSAGSGYESWRSLKYSNAINHAFNNTEKLARNGEWRQAVAELNKIDSFNPDSANRKKKDAAMRQLQHAASEWYAEEADRALKEKNFKKCKDLLKASEGFQASASARRKLDRVRGQLTTVLVTANIDLSVKAADKGDYAGAIKRLNGMDPKKLSSDLVRKIDTARRSINLKWASSYLRSGQFKNAYHKAGEILFTEKNHPEAVRIQREAIRQGTKSYLVTPLYSNLRDVPAGFVSDLNAGIDSGLAKNPTLFLHQIRLDRIMQQLRVRRMTRKHLLDTEALLIGKDLNTDFVIVLDITKFKVYESWVSRSSQKVKTKRGAEAFIKKKSGNLVLTSSVNFVIMNVSTGSKVGSGTVSISHKKPFRSATCETHSLGELVLTREQYNLFDRQKIENIIRGLEDATIKEMSTKLQKDINIKLQKFIR